MKKKIFLITFLCVLLNSSITVGSVEQITSPRLPSVQPALQQLLTIADVPFNILINIAQESTPIFPGYESHPKGSGAGDENTSSKYWTPDSGKSTVRFHKYSSQFAGCTGQMSVFQTLLKIPQIDRRLFLDSTGFLILLLLAYLISLSRSNLPWGMITSCLYKLSPNLQSEVGFFNLLPDSGLL